MPEIKTTRIGRTGTASPATRREGLWRAKCEHRRSKINNLICIAADELALRHFFFFFLFYSSSSSSLLILTGRLRNDVNVGRSVINYNILYDTAGTCGLWSRTFGIGERLNADL